MRGDGRDAYTPSQSRYGSANADADAYYTDTARVVRVDPVFARGTRVPAAGQRCYTEQGTYTGGYGNGTYRDDGYGGAYGDQRTYGTGSTTGRNVATVIGGVVGAALGSQVGGGSARYATAAIGSMVGGMAGRQVYESSHRPQVASVRVCDPVPAGQDGMYGTGYEDERVDGYDVTYEYAGRTYVTRTQYNPGNRIRVRVNVQPET